MYMFEELDTVILTHNIEKHGLEEGDMGTIVHVYKEERAFEVEFTTAEGKTVALLTLKNSDIRPISRGEMLHARPVASI